MGTIFDLCDSELVSKDKFLEEACKRVYNTITNSTNPMVESQLSRELLSPQILGGNHILHSSYLRTALDLLVSEGLLKKKGAQYSKKH